MNSQETTDEKKLLSPAKLKIRSIIDIFREFRINFVITRVVASLGITEFTAENGRILSLILDSRRNESKILRR